MTASVTALLALCLSVVLQVILATTATKNVDTVLADRADAVIGATTAGVGELSTPSDQLDAGVTVYDSAGRVIAGNAPAALAAEYSELGTAQAATTITVAGDRVLAEPFTRDGVHGVVVLAERLEPYEDISQEALWISVGAGTLMVALAAALAAWVSHRALVPVAAMARTADDWSEHDLGRRFDLGPPTNEIAALGHTLDALLEKVSGAIRSEQRLTSELAHELRTPLAAIHGAADLAALHPGLPADVREDVEEIREGSRRMAATIASLLALARSEATMADGTSTSISAAVAEVLATLGDRGTDVEVDVPSDLHVSAPLGLTVRALAPVVENARAAGTHVAISAQPTSGGFIDVDVVDDGPGLPATEAQAIFEPGHTSRSGGSGLGLALARRITRSLGGDVTLVSASTPTRFRIRLPAAWPR